MDTREKINDLVKQWKKLLAAFRELFDAIVATFDMLGSISMEGYYRYKDAMRRYRRKIRKSYRRKRKGRW